MAGKIGVGIVGASAARGWALGAHLPALRANPDFELRAVSASSLDSARAGAKAFGVDLAFGNANDLAACRDVDLVVVTVKAPCHYEPVMAALSQKKMVFCEWPLGRDLNQAQEMAGLAKAQGVHTMVGVQARVAPAVRYLRDLVAEGYVGRVLGTVMVGSGVAWGAAMDGANDYLADPENGATLLSIPAGHAVDGLCFALGEFRTVSSTLVSARGEIIRLEDKKVLPMATPDQIAFSGVLENGALVSVTYRGGVSKGLGFYWEISGTKGEIVLTAENGHIQISPLTIKGARGDDSLGVLDVPGKYHLARPGTPEGPALNVGALYAQFARDLREGIRTVPDFDAAVKRHRLLDAIERAQTTGTRQNL